MFYEPGKSDHGLSFDPFKACVVPRPIGWISTTSPPCLGVEPIYNLAPFSQFNNLTFDPPYMMFASNQTPMSASSSSSSSSSGPARGFGFDRKDTVKNAEATGFFVWQLATYSLREAVNVTAQDFPYTVDEFERAGLEKEWSTVLPVKIPMVAKSPVKFECQVHSTLRLPGNPPMGTVDIVIGRVLGVHINSKYITPEGKLDPHLTEPIARLGYYDYCVVRDTFQMVIPNTGPDMLGGLEGSTKKNARILESVQNGNFESSKEEASEMPSLRTT